jgi:CPA1 family monovalent cation:H+ antiporter
LGPLLRLLSLPKDTTVETEIGIARRAALTAAIDQLENRSTPAAERLRLEYAEALTLAEEGGDPRDRDHNTLRRDAVVVAREAIEGLRRDGTIGDDAYRRVEEELDWLEVSSRPVGD